jgi:glycosyltransferase involved in cell wall biosynthesis
MHSQCGVRLRSSSRSAAGLRADVSVVIPTRNRRPLLARTLSSVLSQRDVSLEVVVVDDGSDDGTRSEPLLDDPRVRYLRHEKSCGVSGARNAGIERASAPWLAFVDDDDLWAPLKLASQLEALHRQPNAGWASSSAVLLDEQLRVRARQHAPTDGLLAHLLEYNVIPGGCSGVLARAELVRSVGGFDESLGVTADWDLWIRLARESAHVTVRRPHVGYVLHGQNMTTRRDGLLAELARIRVKHAALRAEHGVGDVDESLWVEWIADVQRRTGRRLAPALGYGRLGLSKRRPGLVARGVAVAVWPGWVRYRDQRRCRRIPHEWLAEAERWLRPFRDVDVPEPSRPA